MCEMQELCEYLAKVSPLLAELLLPPRRRPSVKARKAAQPDQPEPPSVVVMCAAANSLAGPVARLHPRATRQVLSLAHLAARVASDAGTSSAAATPPARSGHAFDSADKVHAFLKRCGVKRPESANPCLKAGLLRGKLTVPPQFLLDGADADPYLQYVLLTGECEDCGKALQCSVKQAVKQDTCGGDYEEGNPGGAVQCKKCEQGLYITGLCEGRPELTTGKFHNHCDQCPDFGTCIGDYRNDHCSRCGDHFYAGLMGYACPCHGQRGSGSESESDDEGGGFADYGGGGDEWSRDAEPIVDTPDASCWSGQLVGVEHFERDAHEGLLARVRDSRRFLLDLPNEARAAFIGLGGRPTLDAMDFFLRNDSQLESMTPAELRAAAPAALKAIEAIRGVRGLGGEEGEEDGEDDGEEEGEEEGSEMSQD